MATVSHKEAITEKILGILTDKLGVEGSVLERETSFSADLGSDSLDVLEAIMALENAFGIRIPDESIEKLTTVGSVIDYIVAHGN